MTLLPLKGIVRDAEFCKPLGDVKVFVISNSNISTYTDDCGQWRLNIPLNNSGIKFSKPGYIDKSFIVSALPEIVRLLSDRLVGYHDKLHFYPGEVVFARVNSIYSFQARLLRYGELLEEIFDFGEINSSIQSVPDNFFVDKGLNWDISFTYTIPHDVRPGLYGLQLSCKERNSELFTIPMVVSTLINSSECNNKELLVLASTSTWQSYNIYGGRSRYRNFELGQFNTFNIKTRLTLTKEFIKSFIDYLPISFQSMFYLIRKKFTKRKWHFYKLSVKRPFTNCSLEDNFSPYECFTNHLASGEWRILAWLEREKIEYDYISCYELDRNADILQQYKAVLLSTHCEYWTANMYEKLKFYHFNNKLSILNLSGNSIYRQIEFMDDGSSRCISLSFKDSCSDETELLGVRYTSIDYSTAAPYRVILSHHPIFEGCDISDGELFGKTSLNRNTKLSKNTYNPGRPGSGYKTMPFALHGNGASGWETDKRPRNRTKEFILLAKGENPSGGADMVCRMPCKNRGFLFSASSITYGGSLLIDPIISRITKNAIRISIDNCVVKDSR